MYVDGFSEVVVSVCGRGVRNPPDGDHGRLFFTTLDAKEAEDGPELFPANDRDDVDKVRLFVTGLRKGGQRKALPGLIRKAAEWVRGRPAGAFDKWREWGGEAFALVELTVGEDDEGGFGVTAHHLDLPADFLAACAAAKLPVRLDPRA